MLALIEQFLDHISFEQGLSPKTREAYGNDLADFSRFAQAAGVHSPREVTRKLVLGYLEHERDRGLAMNSIARRLVSIKVFFRFLISEGLLEKDVTAVMDSPRLWKVLPGALSVKEVDSLLKARTGGLEARIDVSPEGVVLAIAGKRHEFASAKGLREQVWDV